MSSGGNGGWLILSRSAANWCLIESDPGVFSELIRGFGCTGVQVDELYSLDEQAFVDKRPVHGLIFLFKWRPGDEPSGSVVHDTELFFAQQVIQNACATQALVNLLLNTKHPDVSLGGALSEYMEFTKGFQPGDRGLALSNCEPLRAVHNSFARQTLFEIDQSQATDKDDNYHFITYVPVDGHVYELDGLLPAPVQLAKIEPDQDWLDVVRPIIEQRIQKYSEGEIHFNLMAVISDRMLKAENRLSEIQASGVDDAGTAQEVCQLQQFIEEEKERRANFKVENARRRHNYVPFIVELMRCLAKEGKLVGLVKEAEEKAKKKAAAEAASKPSVKT